VNQGGIEYKINEGTTSIPRELSGKCERKFIAGGTEYTRIPINAIIVLLRKAVGAQYSS
jgi:hypothetical protein